MKCTFQSVASNLEGIFDWILMALLRTTACATTCRMVCDSGHKCTKYGIVVCMRK